jgi:hypothetical protein
MRSWVPPLGFRSIDDQLSLHLGKILDIGQLVAADRSVGRSASRPPTCGRDERSKCFKLVVGEVIDVGDHVVVTFGLTPPHQTNASGATCAPGGSLSRWLGPAR